MTEDDEDWNEYQKLIIYRLNDLQETQNGLEDEIYELKRKRVLSQLKWHLTGVVLSIIMSSALAVYFTSIAKDSPDIIEDKYERKK